MEAEVLFRAAELGMFVIALATILYRLGRMTERFELIAEQQAKEISELKNSVKEIQQVITTQALTTQRMDTFDERVLSEGKRLDKLEDRCARLDVIVSSHPFQGK